MNNHRFSPQRPPTAAGTDHLLLGIGAAVTLDYVPSYEHRLKLSQDPESTVGSRNAHCFHGNRNALQNPTLTVPHDPRTRKRVPHFGHRIDCTGATVRQIPSPATTNDTDLERSPLSPVAHDGQLILDQLTPFPRSPQMMEGMVPKPVTARTTIPLITIGLPTPPASDSSIRDYHCRPSPLSSDDDSSTPFSNDYPMLQTGFGLKLHTGVGLRQHCDVSPPARGHAAALNPGHISPCNYCNGSQHDAPISPVDSLSTLSAAQFEPAGFCSVPISSVVAEHGGVFVNCQTESPACSNDSGYAGSAASTMSLERPSNSRSGFLTVPSPLRHSKSGGNQPSLSAPAPSVSTVSTKGSSSEAPRSQPSGPSSVFVCRLEGCFDRNRCFFLDVENRNEHEILEHNLDCQRITQGIGKGTNHNLEATDQDKTISLSRAQQLDRSSNDDDTESGPKILVTPHSGRQSLTDEMTSLNTKDSFRASTPSKQMGTESTLPESPIHPKNDTSASPGSSSDRASQSATPTTSSSSTLSPDVEMLSPMPKAKMDEMIDKLMDEFESMFDYFLGFDIHDDSIDMSDTVPDSDSDFGESDAEGDDDDMVPAALIASPASGGGSSLSPYSSSDQSSILGSRAKCHTVPGGSSNNTSGSSRASAKAQAGGSSNQASSTRGKRKIQDSERPEDEDEDENVERRKKRQKDSGEDEGLRFACPYFQRHGSASNQGGPKMHASCMYPGFKTVARLKEHLYRCHMQPAHCVRCYRVFTTKQELDDHHLATERCQAISEKRIIDGINEHQAKRLRCRKPKEGVNTEEDKWRDVYFILFPNDREAPSPYCVNSQVETAQLTGFSPASIAFQNFERYSRREFPRLVRTELEEAARREELHMQERLRIVMVDAARRAAETLWDSFRNNMNNQNDSNGVQTENSSFNEGGAPLQQQMEIAPVGPDVGDFLAPPPPQPAAIPDARTVMAERGIQGGSGPGTETTSSGPTDSAYGTLLSSGGSNNLASSYPAAMAAPRFMPTQQQQQQQYAWPNWMGNRMDPGFRPEDWNLFNGQGMAAVEAYLDDDAASLQPPFSGGGPHMGGGDATAAMPQHDYMDRWRKLHGKRFDHDERARKRTAREGHAASKNAQNLRGLRAKLYQEKRRKEKIQMKKAIRTHEERNVKTADAAEPASTPLPQYLLDRSSETNAKALSSQVKQKRNEKAARFNVPLPKVRGISEEEMFSAVNSGKRKHKSWKRMITKPTFVGGDFTRRPVKYERFIRPMGLRYKKANVTHPELGVTVQLPIISVKKNPQNPLYTQLGVLTRGTVIEVNVSDLGLTTTTGKVVWGRWAQITNNPENDGCLNAVLLV
ncbi:ribosome biogenesis protein nsa2 [Diplodia corticola]|uniref:Ribosome biogenesis protein NSA2 n=1 Tax=Diplodia corticola TaxID=236234 RepID=A0A1J9QML6_9PEZI|nr:ribosome biogenesis protein nsa2 [Diplodia corticola]OJD29720.1 ribosome biogenesis protein nsa2 [Diplodia corticola]